MTMRSDFEEHATKGTAAAAELLARACRDTSSRLAKSRMMGCDWTAQAPGGAKLRREQRSVLLTSADALVRAAKADPKAFDDAARSPEGTKLPPLHDVISLSELDPKLAKALEKLPLGEISQPLAASDGFHVVRVLERWPAGALPFEVRGPAIERELYEQHAALLGMQLRERLDLRYEIRTELDVSEWAKGPGATQEELDAKP